MEKKALFKLLVILMSLSCAVYVAAVPATRHASCEYIESPMTKKVDLDHQAKVGLAMDLRNKDEELFHMKEGLDKGRMIMDLADYARTGPNHHHDPKSPGKA